MNQADRRFAAYKWTCGLAAAAVQSAIYFGIGQARLVRSTELLRTRLDDMIPLVPLTAWFYLPIYAAIFIIAIVGFRDPVHFGRALRGVALIMVVGFLGHLLVGAEYPRPVLVPPYADASTAFLAWVHRIDPPGNVFPSLHVAHSSSLALLLHHENPRLGRPVLALAVLLAASTLTTKQHFVADVAAGLALAALTRWIVLRGVRPGLGSPSAAA